MLLPCRVAFYLSEPLNALRRIYFLRKKTTVFSLFSKRGMAKQEFLNCKEKVETEIWEAKPSHETVNPLDI